jgi:hypothetical protein
VSKKEQPRTGYSRAIAILLGVIGVGSFANGLWMLATPRVWYDRIPAEVPDFGPFNEHFVRDVGCAYAAAGIVLGWAVLSRTARQPFVAAAAAFYCLHALVHVYDTARAAVEPVHWLLDFPTTYLPAIVLTVIAYKLRDTERVWVQQSAS